MTNGRFEASYVTMNDEKLQHLRRSQMNVVRQLRTMRGHTQAPARRQALVARARALRMQVKQLRRQQKIRGLTSKTEGATPLTSGFRSLKRDDGGILFIAHANSTNSWGYPVFIALPNAKLANGVELFVSPGYDLNDGRKACFAAQVNCTNRTGQSIFVQYATDQLDAQTVFSTCMNCVKSAKGWAWLPTGLVLDKHGSAGIILYPNAEDDDGLPLFIGRWTDEDEDGEVYFVGPQAYQDGNGNERLFVARCNNTNTRGEAQFEVRPNTVDEIGQPIFSTLYNHAVRPGVGFKNAPGKPIRAKSPDRRSAVRLALFNNIQEVLKSDPGAFLVVTELKTKRWVEVYKYGAGAGGNSEDLVVDFPVSPLNGVERLRAVEICELLGGHLLDSEITKDSDGEDVQVGARYRYDCCDSARWAADVIVRVLTEVYGLECQTLEGLSFQHESG